MQFYQKPIRHLHELDLSKKVIEISMKPEPEKVDVVKDHIPSIVDEFLDEKKDDIEPIIQEQPINNIVIVDEPIKESVISPSQPVETHKYLSALDLLRLNNKL